MTKEELNQFVAEAYDFEEGLNPIFDGINCEENYFNQDTKILWILKEPYDKYGKGTGGWDGCEDICKGHETYIKVPTIRRMAVISYAILNNVSYNEARTQPNLSEILKSIASINVSKYPAGTTSPNRWKYLHMAYEKTRPVLEKQIEYANPDIIICGSVAYLFLESFGLTWEKALPLPYNGRSYWITDKRLIFDAKHPAVRMNQENYCTEIITIAQDWLKQKTTPV